MSGNAKSNAMFIIHGIGRMTQFQFNEPIAIPGAQQPIKLENATLAQATINLNNFNGKILISATVGWFNTFTAAGVAAATFTIRRNGVPIASVVQTVSNPTATAASVSNVARILFVDQPLTEILSMENGPVVAGDIRVTYELTSDATDSTVATTGPITLTLAEIEKSVV